MQAATRERADMKRRRGTSPPRTFFSFTRRYPQIGEAWELLGEAGDAGPLDPKMARLVKLGIHIATRSEGGTHAAVRKELLAGARPEEIYQVLALAAGALGLPNAVAAFTWVEEELKKAGGKRSRRGGAAPRLTASDARS
jgi:alkylhydroperoxidase/carboxymuconolactone decarboxylase family protein YurZ